MDAYPEDYVVHNLPFVLLSGLEPDSEDGLGSSCPDYPLLHERGVHIYSDLPPLSGSTAEELREILLAEDASRTPWEARENILVEPAGTEYKIKSVGRVCRCTLLSQANLATYRTIQESGCPAEKLPQGS